MTSLYVGKSLEQVPRGLRPELIRRLTAEGIEVIHDDETGHPGASGNVQEAVARSLDSSEEVRETMRLGLPNWLQPGLTWATGRPFRGQRPVMPRKGALTHLMVAMVELLGGAAVSAAVVASDNPAAYPLLLVSWLCTIGGARTLQVAIIHQCVHYRFSASRRADRWLGEALSALLLVSPFDVFYRDHVGKHHGRLFATSEDPDCAFLLALGFRPGMSVAALWRQLGWTLVSPVFHARFLAARWRTNFEASIGRGLLGLLPLAAVAGIGLFSGAWALVSIAWVVPLTVGYHAAALLNFASLHVWLGRSPDETGREAIVGLSHGRFAGEAAPVGGSYLAWARWWARMLFVHLPARVAVLVSDLPVHDHHHRHPNCRNWGEHLYTRQRDLENGCPGWPESYTELWGLPSAIGRVFKALSTTPRVEPEPAAARTNQDGFLAM